MLRSKMEPPSVVAASGTELRDNHSQPARLGRLAELQYRTVVIQEGEASEGDRFNT